MRHFLVFLFMTAPVIALAQEDAGPSNDLFETNYLKVMPGMDDDFEKGMSEHNARFHPNGDHQAFVHYVINGERTGQFTWIMGPTSWTHLDSRPLDDDHNDDWANNVMAHTDGSGYNEYWRFRPDMSYKSDAVLYPIIRVRIIDVARGEGYRFRALVMKIREVLEASEAPREWNVYSNDIWHDDGRDWALVSSYNSWSERDEDGTFADDYRALHGANGWDNFLEEWEEVVESAFDEYRTFIPEMSGATNPTE